MRDHIQRVLDQEVLTATEAGDLLGLKRSVIRRRAERGTLVAVKKGGLWLFDRRDIERIATKH